MKRLHYAELENTDDIRGIEFDELKELTNYVYERGQQVNKVFLVTFNIGDDCLYSPIFVGENTETFIALIASCPDFYEEMVDDYFLHEYESYEDAYNGALFMKEGNVLCTSKETV